MTAAARAAAGGGVGRAVGRGAIRLGASLGDQLFYALANFIIHVLLARWLSVESYGIFVVAFVLFLFISGFHNALLSEPVLVFGARRWRRRFAGYLGRVARLHWQVTAGLSLVMAAAGAAARAAGAAELGAALFALALAQPMVLYLWLMRRACYCASRPVIAMLGSLAYLLLLTPIVWLLNARQMLDAPIAIVAMGFAGLLAGAGLHMVMRRGAAHGRSPSMRHVVARHWRYGKWVTLTAVTQWSSQHLFMLALPLLATLAAVGELRAMMNLMMPMQQFVAPLTLLLTPALVRCSGEQAKFTRLLHLAVLGIGATAVIYWVLLIVLGEWTTRQLYGEKYREATDLLWLLGALPVLAAMGGVWRSALKARERSDLVFRTSAWSMAATLTVGLALTWAFGAPGAAAGMVLASAVAAGGALWAVRRTRPRARVAAPTDSVADHTGGAPVRAAWLVPQIAQYRVPLLHRLAARRDEVHVTCYHGQGRGDRVRAVSDTDLAIDTVAVRNVYWRGSLRLIWQRALWPILRGRYDVVICAESVHNLTIWLLWLLRPIAGYQLVLFGYGYRPATMDGVTGRAARCRDHLRQLLMRGTRAAMFYTQRGKQTAVAQGADASRIFVTYNTMDTDYLRSLAEQVRAAELAQTRAALGLHEGPVLIFVGRLLAVKRVDVLIDAVRQLRQRGSAVQALIMGDGPERAALERQAQDDAGIVFADALHDEAQLARPLCAADVLVIPGRVGLMCVHGFAHSLPVVTSAPAVVEQSPEFDYIKPGVNGVVLPGVEPAVYAEAIAQLLNDPARLASMRAAALATSRQLSMDRMAEQFIAAVRFAAGRGEPAAEAQPLPTTHAHADALGR